MLGSLILGPLGDVTGGEGETDSSSFLLNIFGVYIHIYIYHRPKRSLS